MAYKNWMFTINNPEESEDPKAWKGVDYLVYQLEQGADGTPHYQGYVELSKKGRISALKKLNPRAHWDRRNGTQAQAIAYCTKDDTRVEGPWEQGSQTNQGKRTDLEAACATAADEGINACRQQHPSEFAKYAKNLQMIAAGAKLDRATLKRKSVYDNVELRPWQNALVAKLSTPPDDRKIIWLWEATGNVGKTWMAKYLAVQNMATVLDCSKAADLKYLLRPHEGDVVVFNLPRCVDEQFRGHVYLLCEQIKDDLVINTKYESCAIPLGPQHVVVFANEPPDYTKWSEDRYDVTEINDTNPFTHTKTKPKAYKKHKATHADLWVQPNETFGHPSKLARTGACN